MQIAIDVARESAKNDDYAVGAIVVKDDEILAVGRTLLKHENDPTVHAEIVAIREACNTTKSRFLEGAVLYTTHEPCAMCASAAIWAKMKGIVFGATIEDAEKFTSEKFSWRQINIKCRDVLSVASPKLELVEGCLREECNKLFLHAPIIISDLSQHPAFFVPSDDVLERLSYPH